MGQERTGSVADLIEVEYEELPAVFSPGEALADGAPLVHDEGPRTGPALGEVIVNLLPGTNVCNHFKLRKGDVAAGFAAADEVFEDTFSSPAVHHVPMETHACVARVDGDRMTAWSSAQKPFILRAQLAEIFRLSASRVRRPEAVSPGARVRCHGC